MVAIHNKSMGCVDLADMLVALYRIEVNTERRYINIFWQLVDVCKEDGWLFYQRHCKELSIPAAKHGPFLEFSTEIAKALINTDKTLQKKGRTRPKRLSSTIVVHHGGREWRGQHQFLTHGMIKFDIGPFHRQARSAAELVSHTHE